VGVSGKFFDRCRERPLDPVASDDTAAQRLWERSEQLCG
jgi:hypothetical protein